MESRWRRIHNGMLSQPKTRYLQSSLSCQQLVDLFIVRGCIDSYERRSYEKTRMPGGSHEESASMNREAAARLNCDFPAVSFCQKNSGF